LLKIKRMRRRWAEPGRKGAVTAFPPRLRTTGHRLVQRRRQPKLLDTLTYTAPGIELPFFF